MMSLRSLDHKIMKLNMQSESQWKKLKNMNFILFNLCIIYEVEMWKASQWIMQKHEFYSMVIYA